ncbi:hypothetical protein BJ322DRAFT_1111592 [Thelephora terrestris]|uniref:DUF6533 domain-containing protein n=1 Tax=Thelephora terrestris TaxID=56493 RepID=A0A9P6L3H6_9AGAM|nr:hypothetical protein BJ322DRAFT_1111592 [Thelephora terrestris]
MSSAQLEEVIVIGNSILLAKRYIISFTFLWFWDYALTFKDEVNYAWKGRKSWVFVLFLLVRATAIPDMDALRIVLARIFSKGVRPHHSRSDTVHTELKHFSSVWRGYRCDRTAFLEILYFNFVTVFAQTTLTLRVYIVTERNKLLTAVPGFITLTQFFFGCYVWVQVYRLGAVVWPSINYDSFRLCFFNQTEIQQVLILSFSLIYDLLAFLIIIWVGRKSSNLRGSKFPSILDKIVKDATLYFLVIFTSHLLVECFLLFAPTTYHLLPAK